MESAGALCGESGAGNVRRSGVISGNAGHFDCVRLSPHFAQDDSRKELTMFSEEEKNLVDRKTKARTEVPAFHLRYSTSSKT